MSNDGEHIPGQMDIDECIEVASSGSDGKVAAGHAHSVTSPRGSGGTKKEDVPPRRPAPKRRPMTIKEVVRLQLAKKDRAIHQSNQETE